MIINTGSIQANQILFKSDDNSLYVKSMIDNIKNSFKLSPSYFQITKNNDVSTKIDCWITEIKDTASKDGIDKKNIILYPDLILNRGDYIHWTELNETFLVMEKNISPYYDNGVMEHCQNKIIFKNNKGIVVNYPCVVSVIGRMYLDIIDSKSVILPKDTLMISVQSNEDTLQVVESMRFILSGDAFKVMAKSKVVINGVVQFKMQSDLLRSDDNLVTGLASQSVITPTTPTNLSISGSTSVKISTSSNYTILNNVNNTFSWSIVDAISGLTTTNASITSSTTTTCTVKGGTVAGKQCKLLATCIEVPTTVLTIILTVSGGF